MNCFEEYHKELSLSDRDPKTIARYWQIIDKYREWLGERYPDIANVKEYIANLRDNGYRARSVLLHYHALKLFFEFLGLRLNLKLRKPQILPPYFDQGDIKGLIAQAQRGLRGQSPEKRRRNTNLILVLAYTGIRKSELLHLTVGDLDFNRYTVTIRQGKGKRDRVIPMSETIVTSLREQCDGKSSNDSVFDGLNPRSVYRIVTKLAKKCGLNGFHPHSLRHYFGTQLAENGANLRDVQELMGHQSLETTAIYIDVSPTRLANTVALLDKGSEAISKNTTGECTRRLLY